MKIVHCLGDLPSRHSYIATVGNFDGLHIGHRFLLAMMKRYARERKAKTLLISFFHHTRVSMPTMRLIHSPKQKREKLKKLGLDFQLLLDFDKMKRHTYSQFLIETHRAIRLSMFIGSNKLCIGKNRQGTMNRIRKALRSIAPDVEVLTLKSQGDESGRPISSTRIRACLKRGEVGLVAKLLGEYFSLEGIVRRGRKQGREIGFPTLNIYPDASRALPKPGVYFSRVQLKGKLYRALTFVGAPSLKEARGDSSCLRVESYLFNFSDTGYNSKMRVDFLEFLRPNKKVGTWEELKALIAGDESQAREFFKSYKLKY